MNNTETEVERLRAALQRSQDELSSFTYSVSHELKAPVRHLHGYVELLRSKLGTVLDEKALHYLQSIDQASVHMAALIEGVSELSSLASRELKPETLELSTLVLAVWNALEGHAGVAFEVAPLPNVCGDRSLMQRLWVNLLGNAIKFSRPNDHPRVTVSFEVVADEGVFLVKDNGVGFDEAYGSRLFGMFQRMHSEHEFDGIGTGLAQVRAIVQRHGGQVGARAKLGTGAEFWFTLPPMKGGFIYD